jgi:crossover junction endodeoxyribonuclease RuvC
MASAPLQNVCSVVYFPYLLRREVLRLRILGIDPGVGTIGFGLIEADRSHNTLLRYGVITTPPNTQLSDRLLQIHRDMKELLETFQPEEVAIEELFFSKNITTGISVAHGRGVILMSIAEYGIPVYEYTPNQVKQSVVGYGGADKRQVMLMTQRLLHLDRLPRPDDAADALALAICHSRAATSLLNTERRFDPRKYDTR